MCGEETMCVDEAEDVDEDFDACCKCGQEKGGCARDPL
jgi:hypothetical protein